MRNIVVIDQEVSTPDGIALSTQFGEYDGPATFHRLVMCQHGRMSWLDEEAIEDGSLIVSDWNAMALRNERSLSQAWWERDWTGFVGRLQARGCAFRTVSNFAFGPQDGKINGGPFAARNLWARALRDPEWLLSASRPLRALEVHYGTPEREESAALKDKAGLNFRRAEDAQKYGRLPEFYDEAVAAMVAPLTNEERKELFGVLDPEASSFNTRRALAVIFSVLDEDGKPLRRADGSQVTHDYARRYIARLHGQARGVGGPIRACLRSIGKGKHPERLPVLDRAFKKAARALLASRQHPTEPETSSLPMPTVLA